MSKKNFLKSPIYLILVMTIVLLLMLLFTNYGKVNVLEPTGNIDIFEITIENNYKYKKSNFKNIEELKIFSNPAYKMKTIITPGSSNAYQFVIKNSNNFNVQYSIEMKETNKYGVNIKYRLKQDGRYIIGNDKEWVTANELIVENVKIKRNSNIPYILEWKWFESNNDTEIGKIDGANYKLSIKMVAGIV